MKAPEKNNTIVVEVWSDIACPFCYIGLKRFEQAVERFPVSLNIDFRWKTFLLNPDLKTNSFASTLDYLVATKGISVSEVEQMMQGVVAAGKTVDIPFDFKKAKVANSLRAHALLKSTTDHDIRMNLKRQLFDAQFLSGKNIDDKDFLIEMGKDAGIDLAKLEANMNNPEGLTDINTDLQEARSIGISGVPFFVFDRSFALVGAQSVEVFGQALEKAFTLEKA